MYYVFCCYNDVQNYIIGEGIGKCFVESPYFTPKFVVSLMYFKKLSAASNDLKLESQQSLGLGTTKTSGFVG